METPTSQTPGTPTPSGGRKKLFGLDIIVVVVVLVVIFVVLFIVMR